MPTFGRWTMAVSAEQPSTQIGTVAGESANVSTWLPNAAAIVQYQWSQGEHVRLAAVVRQLAWRDLLAGKNHNSAGWAGLMCQFSF